MAFAGRKLPESIYKSVFYHIIDSLAFLFGKTVFAFIGFWVGKVILGVGHI